MPSVFHAQLAGLRERHDVSLVTVAGPDQWELDAVARLRAAGVDAHAIRRVLPVRHVARRERVPVDGAARDDVGAAALEALRQEDAPFLAGQRGAEQQLPGALVAVDHARLEVVPGRPVEVDGDRPVAERLADRARDCVEQRGQILTRPQKAGDLDEAPQR